MLVVVGVGAAAWRLVCWHGRDDLAEELDGLGLAVEERWSGSGGGLECKRRRVQGRG